METPSDESGDRPTTLVTLGPQGSNASRPDSKKADNKKATPVDAEDFFEAALIEGLEDERE
jgi:hypothetical protein